MELMIVIAILGILASIAIPTYNGYLERSRMSEAKRNIVALRQAQEEYYLENNEYFKGDDTAEVEAESDNLWEAQGTDGAPLFDYAVNISGKSYTITATGKAGTPVAGKTAKYPD
ncbi:MAG: type IV pilin protein [Thiohalophilus sp.]